MLGSSLSHPEFLMGGEWLKPKVRLENGVNSSLTKGTILSWQGLDLLMGQ